MKPRQRVDNALQTMRERLKPFVVKHLTARYGDHAWMRLAMDRARERKVSIKRTESDFKWDSLLTLNLLNLFWHDVFGKAMPRTAEAYIRETRELRHRFAHEETLTAKEADRGIDTIKQLLNAAGVAPVGTMKTVGVFQPKGGCGKSSLTVFLADFLTTVHGKRGLLVDLDPQKASSKRLLGIDRVEKAMNRKASLPALLRKVFDGKADRDLVRSYFMERPAYGVVGKQTPLQEVQVMACDDNDWWKFNNEFIKASASDQRRAAKLLRTALELVADEFDICLIDFPAHDRGPMAKLGLHATDRWLFPCQASPMVMQDLDPAINLVREVNQAGGSVMPLATVLNECQSRASSEYRDARVFLEAQVKENMIPSLVDKKSEILHRVDAITAVGRKANARTLVEKYGARTSPFFTELNHLAKTVLKRLNLPFEELERLAEEGDALQSYKGFAVSRRPKKG